MQTIPSQYNKVNLYFQDESRFGLFTHHGRMLTAKGVKPICKFQQVYKSQYLFGAFSPINGNHFLYEMNCCDSTTFQLFLDEFSKYEKDEFKIIILDNGAFHKAKSLSIPHNIILFFLPPYSPELNPAEKMWQHFKRKFQNKHFKSIEGISQFFTSTINELTKKIVKNICEYEYVFLDINWTI